MYKTRKKIKSYLFLVIGTFILTEDSLSLCTEEFQKADKELFPYLLHETRKGHMRILAAKDYQDTPIPEIDNVALCIDPVIDTIYKKYSRQIHCCRELPMPRCYHLPLSCSDFNHLGEVEKQTCYQTTGTLAEFLIEIYEKSENKMVNSLKSSDPYFNIYHCCAHFEKGNIKSIPFLPDIYCAPICDGVCKGWSEYELDSCYLR